MASAATKFAAKKLLGKEMNKYKHKPVEGKDDPFFEEITLPNGRKKKVKKQVPEFIPSPDAEILRDVKKLAYRYDMALFNFAGIRFGWGSVIGLIPEVGDVVDLGMSLYVYKKCKSIKGGLPMRIKLQMLFWIFIDFIVGLIPFVGDLIDASIKCNVKMCALLEARLLKKYGPHDEEARLAARREDFSDEEDTAAHPQHQHRPHDANAPLSQQPAAGGVPHRQKEGELHPPAQGASIQPGGGRFQNSGGQNRDKSPAGGGGRSKPLPSRP